MDGLIILGDMTKPYIEQIEKEGGVPVVCLDFYNDAVGLDTVISNSFYGTYALTNYLFSMGHTKIAYVGTVGMTNSITDRYLGYRKSMMEHRVDVPKDYVIDDRDTKPGVWIWKNIINFRKICRRHLSVTAILQLRI